jgi:hypothetical protein
LPTKIETASLALPPFKPSTTVIQSDSNPYTSQQASNHTLSKPQSSNLNSSIETTHTTSTSFNAPYVGCSPNLQMHSLSSIGKSWLISETSQRKFTSTIINKRINMPQLDMHTISDIYSYIHPNPFVSHDIISVATSQHNIKEPLHPVFDFSTPTPEEKFAERLKAKMLQNITEKTIHNNNNNNAINN